MPSLITQHSPIVMAIPSALLACGRAAAATDLMDRLALDCNPVHASACSPENKGVKVWLDVVLLGTLGG